jgi:hypothetical protein
MRACRDFISIARHQQQHSVGVLCGVEDPGGSGELVAAFGAEMQPGDIVLLGVVSVEAG